MSISAQQVADLRSQTGAGMMDVKQALEESGGDLALAAELLRKKGVAKAAKKADRETHEGRVHAYIHATGKLGALVEVLCETDFVARNDAFIEFCHDLAMQVSATDPLYVNRQDVPADLVEKEKAFYLAELVGQAKPLDVMEKIITGKLNKWFSEVVLLEQPFIKDEDKTIEEFVKEKIASLGENIQVKRFARFTI